MFTWAFIIWLPWYLTGDLKTWAMITGFFAMIVVDIFLGSDAVRVPKVKEKTEYTR
jgi:hypothetical protein